MDMPFIALFWPDMPFNGLFLARKCRSMLFLARKCRSIAPEYLKYLADAGYPGQGAQNKQMHMHIYIRSDSIYIYIKTSRLTY
jgi:hypothetical protein